MGRGAGRVRLLHSIGVRSGVGFSPSRGDRDQAARLSVKDALSIEPGRLPSGLGQTGLFSCAGSGYNSSSNEPLAA